MSILPSLFRDLLNMPQRQESSYRRADKGFVGLGLRNATASCKDLQSGRLEIGVGKQLTARNGRPDNYDEQPFNDP